MRLELVIKKVSCGQGNGEFLQTHAYEGVGREASALLHCTYLYILFSDYEINKNVHHFKAFTYRKYLLCDFSKYKILCSPGLEFIKSLIYVHCKLGEEHG